MAVERYGVVERLDARRQIGHRHDARKGIPLENKLPRLRAEGDCAPQDVVAVVHERPAARRVENQIFQIQRFAAETPVSRIGERPSVAAARPFVRADSAIRYLQRLQPVLDIDHLEMPAAVRTVKLERINIDFVRRQNSDGRAGRRADGSHFDFGAIRDREDVRRDHAACAAIRFHENLRPVLQRQVLERDAALRDDLSATFNGNRICDNVV